MLILCVLLASCQTKEAPKERVSFEHAEFSDITPMTDGSAYAKSADSQLWYIRGEQAVRVTLSPIASDKLPESFDVWPLADGSAYLIVLSGGGGVWHLRGEHAQKVTEVSALTSARKAPALPDRGFYALYIAEHKKRKAAEDPAETPPEPPDYDPY
jgi:hypothetical protein